MRLFLLLALLAVSTLGCADDVLAPTQSAMAQTESKPVRAWVEVEGQRVLAWVEYDPIQKAYRILYICDYPMDYAGPLQSGHCRVDGSDCHGDPIGPTGTYAAPGDPEIGNEAGDPDVGNEMGDPTADDILYLVNPADADGIVIR